MKIFQFFRRKNSGSIAKDRLKLLLVSDRANCSPEVMGMIKNDIVNIISKYMDIDRDGIEIKIKKTKTANGVSPVLFANIPIKDMKISG